jgi:hypothetical protein
MCCNVAFDSVVLSSGFVFREREGGCDPVTEIEMLTARQAKQTNLVRVGSAF